jgi:hypothetical protein
MDPLNEPLARLGRAIAEVNGPDADAIADARRRWARSPRPARARRWTRVVAPALAIAATVAIIASRSTSDDERSLTYTVGDVPGERGQWIAAREPVWLHFSDGSRVEVARHAKVRVAAMDRLGGTIDLEQGALHADVAHRDASTWRFRTGPYTVLVKGTRFDAAWDANRERFTLDLLQGKVEVMGPLLPVPVTVLAGQSLVASVGEQRFEIRAVRTADATTESKNETASSTVDPAVVSRTSIAAEGPLQATTAQSTTTRPHSAGNGVAAPATVTTSPLSSSTTAAPQRIAKADQPSASPVPPASTAAAATPERTEKWREFLAARAYSSAIAAAEQRGFEAVVADATSAELYALSDAARYAGRPERARDALIAVRARFGEQGKTAFLLGRIAADQGEAGTAIEWFDRYLREQPGGPLAETATGRLIELYRPRDASRAGKLAERYLAAYPDGSYAALARTLVEH